MNPSTQAARVLVQALAANGVRHVVLSPGSRSAPLAYALAHTTLPEHSRAVTAPRLKVHVRIDERCAGFLAVGLARAASVRGEMTPVAVVTTSGSAVANLHPAVLEAHHAGLPLLLLTADRPHELRGTGANQMTEQKGIFGSAIRLMLDLSAPVGGPRDVEHLRKVAAEAVAVATGTRLGDPGPVHINLAYRAPLVPDDAEWPLKPLPSRKPKASAAAPPAKPVWVREVADELVPRGWTADERTVVVAGDGAGPMAREIAELNGWPLLAEPSSGARGGPNSIPAYRLLLGTPLGQEVRRAVVLGRPTLNRAVDDLLTRRGVRTLAIVDRGSAQPDMGRGLTHLMEHVPAWLLGPTGRTGEVWLARWRAASRTAMTATKAVLKQAALESDGMCGPAVAGAVATAAATEGVLVVGASNPIRDLDLMAAWGEPPIVVSNRGVSGIDGTVSTAVGLALGLDRPVRAYLGDLSFLHDIGGLLIGPLEQRPDLQLVVANDDGGSVFATLEHGAPEHAAVFERFFAATHELDLAALCTGYGVEHVRVADTKALRSAMAGPVSGLSVVEVAVDRAGRRHLHELLAAGVTDALAAAEAKSSPDA
jgi:2-succinyl-5-enolpyruvyl-6-hydroxy-3-cyclohexene-1-carboxylate synthase